MNGILPLPPMPDTTDCIILAAGMVLLPMIYVMMILLYRTRFESGDNQKRKPLHSVREYLMLMTAEAAYIRIWGEFWKHGIDNVLFGMLLVMLAAMTFFCMADYWERVVPNRVLLILLLIWVVIIGFAGIRDMQSLMRILPSALLGFVFCLLSFGTVWLFGRQNVGAGDVKLALLMGLYLTGEYVVGTILYGCLAAAIFSIFQMMRGKLSRKDQIPFVPFLYIGLTIRYFVG